MFKLQDSSGLSLETQMSAFAVCSRSQPPRMHKPRRVLTIQHTSLDGKKSDGSALANSTALSAPAAICLLDKRFVCSSDRPALIKRETSAYRIGLLVSPIEREKQANRQQAGNAVFACMDGGGDDLRSACRLRKNQAAAVEHRNMS
ncbi:hypothetical protein GGF40_002662 [Coemansia sp. RSA 1286]|nr:hypothetical protein GGF40_002662 [Coemansia sp. RSA 1286]